MANQIALLELVSLGSDNFKARVQKLLSMCDLMGVSKSHFLDNGSKDKLCVNAYVIENYGKMECKISDC